MSENEMKTRPVPFTPWCFLDCKVFHYCHFCSGKFLIISVHFVPTPITQAHIHRKAAKIPMFWVTGNTSEKLCIILSHKGVSSLSTCFWNDLAATSHKLSHPKEEKVCGVFKRHPVRAGTLYRFIVLVFFFLPKPEGIIKGESTVQRLWISPADKQAPS